MLWQAVGRLCAALHITICRQHRLEMRGWQHNALAWCWRWLTCDSLECLASDRLPFWPCRHLLRNLLLLLTLLKLAWAP